MARKSRISELEESEDKFFSSGGTDGIKEEPAPDPVAEEPQEPKAERPRDETGKFKKEEPKEEVEAKKEDEPKQSMVPHGALHEEREKRKKFEREFNELKAQSEAERKRNEERWAQMMERLNPKPQAPSVEQDAVGHFQHKTAELERQLQATQQETAQIRQLNAQQAEWQRFTQAYSQAVHEYASRTPDYLAAHTHFLNALKAEIQATGYEPMQANHIAMQQEAAIVAKAFQDGVNPAERIYAISKMRGYAQPQQQVAQDPKAGAEKLEKIDQGQRASAATVSGGGKPKMTWQDIASMSDDDFKKFDWDKIKNVA
jgi:hypothetical protein